MLLTLLLLLNLKIVHSMNNAFMDKLFSLLCKKCCYQRKIRC
jgi:hypothetical protein